jgi:hypothetical protein
MENILRENTKQREDLLKLKYSVSKNNIETLALIINELYSLGAITDIELKVLIQEEDYGSLFTKPHFLVKVQLQSESWYKKDTTWMLEAVPHEEKNLRPEMVNDLMIVDYKKNLGWSDEVLTLVNHLSLIMDDYDWSQFTNIGKFKNSPLWSSYQDQSKAGTNEYVWIGSFSPKNYISNLSLISWNVDEQNLKELIINREKERLEMELAINNNSNRIKSKI